MSNAHNHAHNSAKCPKTKSKKFQGILGNAQLCKLFSTPNQIFCFQDILGNARPDAAAAIFLITDGFSNGGDPRPLTAELRARGVRVFTIGIRNGNPEELREMATDPDHCYILDDFEEFEALARRALHQGKNSYAAGADGEHARTQEGWVCNMILGAPRIRQWIRHAWRFCAR